MPVPTAMSSLSATAASNYPQGSDNVFPDLDDYLRVIQSILRQLYDDVSSQASTSKGAAMVGYLAGGSVSVGRTVASKLGDFLSVYDKGANGGGVSSDSGTFTNAASDYTVNDVRVPRGAFLLSTTPSNGGVAIYDTSAGATFTGSGATALGFTDKAYRQLVQHGSTGADFAIKYVRRNAAHSGGAAGFVSSALRAETYATGTGTNNEWAATFMMDNSVPNVYAAQNVAMYALGKKRSGASPTWGAVIEHIDYSGGNPASGAVSLEVDITGNGGDSGTARIGIDIAARSVPDDSTSMTAGYGIRFQNSNSTNATFATLIGTKTGVKATEGLTLHAATITGSAIKLAQDQVMSWNAGATRQTTYDGTGWKFKDNSGNLLFRANDDGSIQLGRAFTSASVPANFTASVMIPIKSQDGTTYYVPAKSSTW